ncbi:MAG TPA: cohesin domain-containing protein [Bacteroidales bacterium]|nr:cohesin domain-containing protein [Bacteroidales bacterium]
MAKNKIIISITLILFSLMLQSQDISITVGTVSSETTNVQVSVPFTVSGLNGAYMVTAMEFYIDFDSTIVDYVQVENLYSGTPSNEWFFTLPPTNRFACNWVQSQLQPIAIPNGTKLFDIVFYYKKPMNVLLDLDEINCVLADATYQQIPNSLISFNDGAINFTGYIPSTGLVELNPENILSFPDTIFSVSVRLSDFDDDNASLAAMELMLEYDHAMISFEEVQNFNSLVPENQWVISQPEPGQLLCLWNHSSQQNVIIPDSTVIFDINFKGINEGISLVAFDSTSCSFTHYHNGQPNTMFANFGDANVQILSIPDPPPGLLAFSPSVYVTYPDSLIVVPFEISGFSSNNSSIFSMGFAIDYDGLFLEYQSIDNFNNLLPQTEWTITQMGDQLVLYWNNTQGYNISIPDQTVLAEITFKAVSVGNTQINFSEPSFFYHQFYQYVLEFQAEFTDAVVQIYDNSMPLPGFVRIEPSNFITNPDSTVHLPILMSGFDQDNSSLSGIQLFLDFDDQIVSFLEAENFSSILPADQWTIVYDDTLSRMVCSWNEPNGQNVQLPENTTIFELSFLAANTGTSVFSFDSAACIYTHELLGNYYQLLANHSGTTVQVNAIPPPTPGTVAIVPSNYYTYPDSLVFLPVVISGFNLDDNSLSNMELHLLFDNEKLDYQSVVNFSGILPQEQWSIIYDQANSRIVCQWNEPNTQNISIPDNTLAFQLIFKAIDLGTTILEFDAESSVFIHQLNGTNQYGSAIFGNAIVEITELPIPPPGLLAMIPNQYSVYEGAAFNVPVLMSGFGLPNSGLSYIELHIDFDNSIIIPEEITNFNVLLPEDQWTITYDVVSSSLMLIWNDPNGQNTLIPDGAVLFEMVFNGISPGISAIEFDEQTCEFIHQQFAGQVSLDADFSNASATVLEIVLPDAPKVKLIPGYIVDYSGLSVSVDVVLFGFNTDTTSLAAIEFYIDFDNISVEYIGVDNFNALMPQNQWFFSNPSPDLNRFACNWAEPSLQNIVVPDSTTIMTLHFLLHVEETPLTFDQPANVFVNIDEQFNLIELEVAYSDGYIVVLPDGIQSNQPENTDWYSVSNQVIHLFDVQGVARIFNLAGQQLYQTIVSDENNQIELQKPGIFILSIISENGSLLNAKIFIQ